MTTQNFIEKHLHTEDQKQRFCASVFTDGNGNFWSYGYHYPLLKRINNKFYVNDKGYSVSTAKHINWAYSATGYKAFRWNNSYDTDSPLKAAKLELKELKELLPKLRKNAFRKRAYIEDRINNLTSTVESFS
jgi:hypothetical protein